MINLTEQRALSIYEIAEFWAQETQTPHLNLLRRMAPGVLLHELKFTPTNPFPDDFTDEGWISTWLRNPFYCSYWDGKFQTGFIVSPADYALSALNYLMESDHFKEPIFHNEFKRKAISHYRNLPYPKGLGFFAEKSLEEILSAIKIRQCHFRIWCQESGYPLPRFWFGEQKQALEEPFEKLEGDAEFIKCGRIDSMNSEIEDIIKSGTPAKPEMVWRELVNRAGIKGGCVLEVETTDTGPKICWRTASGLTKRLDKKALAERLRRRE